MPGNRTGQSQSRHSGRLPSKTLRDWASAHRRRFRVQGRFRHRSGSAFLLETSVGPTPCPAVLARAARPGLKDRGYRTKRETPLKRADRDGPRSLAVYDLGTVRQLVRCPFFSRRDDRLPLRPPLAP